MLTVLSLSQVVYGVLGQHATPQALDKLRPHPPFKHAPDTMHVRQAPSPSPHDVLRGLRVACVPRVLQDLPHSHLGRLVLHACRVMRLGSGWCL